MVVEGFVDLLNVLLCNCNGKLLIKLSGYGPAPHLLVAVLRMAVRRAGFQGRYGIWSERNKSMLLD
jgi:hypothetical protein